MCDYSLHHVASRAAEVGDKLTSTKFQNSITGGFAAVGEPEVAVCLRPGTELAFDQNVVYSRGFGLIPPRFGYATISQRVARFRHFEPYWSNTHHDALEFPNGEMVLVTQCWARDSPRPCCKLLADPEHRTAASSRPFRQEEPFAM